MATALKTFIDLNLIASLESGASGQVGGIAHQITLVRSLVNGTSEGQCDRVYQVTSTLAASGTDTYDLAGVVENVYGTVISFAEVQLLAIQSQGATGQNLTIGKAASNPVTTIWSGTSAVEVVPGGGTIMKYGGVDGYAITAGSADSITVTNTHGSASITYTLLIVGRSA